MRVLPALFTVLLVATSTGCSSYSGPVVSAADFAQRYPPGSANLSSGDKLHITLYGDDSFTADYSILSDGSIVLPLLGQVEVGGKSVAQVQALLEERLSKGLYSNPRVNVQLIELQPVYVLGEVGRPGSYPFAPDMTLSKAVALAGGYTYRAKNSVIAVRRAGGGAEIFVRGDPALQLAPGDTVRILERSL